MTEADICSFVITLWQVTSKELPSQESSTLQRPITFIRLSQQPSSRTVSGKRLEKIIQCCWAARALQPPSAELVVDFNSLKAKFGGA